MKPKGSLVLNLILILNTDAFGIANYAKTQLIASNAIHKTQRFKPNET